MKKALLASLCGAFVIGACAMSADTEVKPQTAWTSGLLISITV